MVARSEPVFLDIVTNPFVDEIQNLPPITAPIARAMGHRRMILSANFMLKRNQKDQFRFLLNFSLQVSPCFASNRKLKFCNKICETMRAFQISAYEKRVARKTTL
ncbi:hypothetical protein THS27_19760 [Thalassospira sp. MCCC 1A01428]|nr:hypothetical protein THS27_19760 [Thalassospira sp. MCCC 1A01428]